MLLNTDFRIARWITSIYKHGASALSRTDERTNLTKYKYKYKHIIKRKKRNVIRLDTIIYW